MPSLSLPLQLTRPFWNSPQKIDRIYFPLFKFLITVKVCVWKALMEGKKSCSIVWSMILGCLHGLMVRQWFIEERVLYLFLFFLCWWWVLEHSLWFSQLSFSDQQQQQPMLTREFCVQDCCIFHSHCMLSINWSLNQHCRSWG